MTARLEPMPADQLATWRESAATVGEPLPEAGSEGGDGDYDAVHLFVDEVLVGAAVLIYDVQGGVERASLRRLQTTLEEDARPQWGAVIGMLEDRARRHGAETLVTAVPPSLAGPFTAAGFQATMTTISKSYDPDVGAVEMQEDLRVVVRPMSDEERRRYADEVLQLVREGMERAGVVAGQGADLGDLPDRVARLAADPPPADELLLTGLVDDVPVGRLWGTLVTHDDGSVGYVGHSVDLFPEFRGQGLTRSFFGALRRELEAFEVGEIRGRLYAHQAGTRRASIAHGAAIDDVHLRKDLG